MTLDIEAMKLAATDSLPNKRHCGVELSPDDVLALVAEVERLREQIEAVKELHKPSEDDFGETCSGCYGITGGSEYYPCPTVQAIENALGVE